MTKRQGIRTVLFIIILSGILFFIGVHLTSAQTDDVIMMTRRFDEMREDPKDSWDGVWLGTSVADRAWAAPLAWDQYGMALYPMSTDGQPFILTVSMLEEITRYQDVSFAVIELHGLRPSTMKTNGARIRWITENIKSWKIKFEATTKALEYMDRWYPGRFDESVISRLSYYIPLLKFHSRLTQDEFYTGDFDSGETLMKGVYNASRRVYTYANPIEPTLDTPAGDITQQQQEMVDELCQYADENGIELVFVNTPSELSDKDLSYINAVAEYVEEKGYAVLNFNDSTVLEESGISGQDDFIDERHLNTKGAHKFTEYTAAWLKEQLDIPDHRGEEEYQSWDEAFVVYEDFYEQCLIDIENWIKENIEQ